MKQFLLAVALLNSLFGVNRYALAEISIDQLIDQANIAEGDTAVRDLPHWRGAQKIVVWDIGIDVASLIDQDSRVEVVIASSIEEAKRHVADADAIIGFCHDDLFLTARKLVWVQIYWAGAERCLSVDRIGSGDVLMTNMQKMSSPVIAEHAIAMVISLARNLPQFVHRMDDAQWDDRGTATQGMTPISGKKLLVAGLGGIGTEVARLGAALGMQVTGTRNSSREGPDFIHYVGLADELPVLAAEADVIVNALPLTPSTQGLFDRTLFSKLKGEVIFVNVGRGATVNTVDLIAALESGQVGSAGLDVTDPEPLPADSPLWSRTDVIITPHVAGSGGERERHTVLLRENLRRYIAGEKLLNVVDPAKGY